MQQVTDKEFRALITLLDDNDKEIFSHVSDKLFSLGVEGIPMLESAWRPSKALITVHSTSPSFVAIGITMPSFVGV